jgi:hypothetical protein
LASWEECEETRRPVSAMICVCQKKSAGTTHDRLIVLRCRKKEVREE